MPAPSPTSSQSQSPTTNMANSAAKMTNSTPKMTNPTRRAVHYLRDTWRRIKKSPQKAATHLHIPSSPPRHPYGACIDRTQLADVVSDDDFTVVGSNPSAATSSTTASSYVTVSPMIRDADWRYFSDTQLKSSPSTFLGTSWSPAEDEKPINREKEQLLTSQDGSNTVKQDDMSDIYNATPRRMRSLAPLQFSAIDVTAATDAHATMWRAPRGSHKDTMGRYHDEDVGRGRRSSHASSLSASNPTFRTAAAARREVRRISDSILVDGGDSVSPGSSENLLGRLVRDIKAGDYYTFKSKGEDSTPLLAKRVPARGPLVVRAIEIEDDRDDEVSEDRFSFASIRGGCTAHEVVQHDTSDLPPTKRRKVTPIPPTISSLPPASPLSSVGRKNHEEGQKNPTRSATMPPPPPPPRRHPRYNSDLNNYDSQLRTRRIVNFRQGSAVLMPFPSSRIGA